MSILIMINIPDNTRAREAPPIFITFKLEAPPEENVLMARDETILY
jgi:hypothetical protein